MEANHLCGKCKYIFSEEKELRELAQSNKWPQPKPRVQQSKAFELN